MSWEVARNFFFFWIVNETQFKIQMVFMFIFFLLWERRGREITNNMLILDQELELFVFFFRVYVSHQCVILYAWYFIELSPTLFVWWKQGETVAVVLIVCYIFLLTRRMLSFVNGAEYHTVALFFVLSSFFFGLEKDMDMDIVVRSRVVKRKKKTADGTLQY